MTDLLPGFAGPRAATSLYRYTLTRTWDVGKPLCAWVMLNPSTATEEVDDPTIRRVKWFAFRHGYGRLMVVNLYALRATNPAALKAAIDPTGKYNDHVIAAVARRAEVVICAWGAHPFATVRAEEVTALLREVGTRMVCLDTTKAGMPRHPLYVKSATRFKPYEVRA